MYRITAFGGLTLLDPHGRIAESVRGRNLALLALLARAGNPGLTREKLAAYLWPESNAARARHSLDQALYTVRRALDADPFISGASTLALDPAAVSSDVSEFSRALEAGELREAIEQYRGAFLDGFHLSDALEFERWVDAERAELHRLYTESLETLAREASDVGDEEAAVGYWRRLAAASPLSSRVTLGLMHALDRAGNRAGAIQAAAVHAALMEEELDAPVDPAVRALVAELRQNPAEKAVTPAAEDRPQGRGTREAPVPDTPAPDTDAASAPAPGDRGREGRAGWRGRRARLAVSFGLAVVLVGALLLSPGRDQDEPSTRPRVVVAPFENETSDPAFDPFRQLAADWITEGLAMTGLVEVLAVGGAEAEAESVVEGRLYRTGDSIRVQARIVSPRDGTVVRALEALTVDAADPSAVLEPLRQHVLGAMGTLYDPRLAAWAGTGLRPPSYAAYQELAAGVEHHAVPRDLSAAAARFQRAMELDPDYLLAHLWLAWSRLMADDYAGADSTIAALASHREEMAPAERAWHDRIAALLNGDSEASYQAARRLVELAPRSGWAIALANAALATNRPEVAIETVLATGVDNVGLEREQAWTVLTAAYHRLGDYSKELATAEEAIRSDGLDWGYTGPGVAALAAFGRVDALERRLEELEGRPPAYGMPLGPIARLTAVAELRAHGFEDAAQELGDRILDTGSPPAEPAHPMLEAELLYELGRWEEAERVLQSVDSDPSGFRVRALTALLAARQGDPTTARQVADSLAAIDRPYLFGEPTFWRARIAAVLGDDQGALDLLRQSFREGRGGEGWHQLHVARDFDGLRGQEGFQELLRPR